MKVKQKSEHIGLYKRQNHGKKTKTTTLLKVGNEIIKMGNIYNFIHNTQTT